jgi:hypothetical protein
MGIMKAGGPICVFDKPQCLKIVGRLSLNRAEVPINLNRSRVTEGNPGVAIVPVTTTGAPSDLPKTIDTNVSPFT